MRNKTLVATVLAAAVIGTTGTAFAAPQSTSQSPQSTSQSAAGTNGTCDTDGHWPAYVQGRPDGFDAGDNGAYLWHNPSGGWGLRVSHPVLPGKANKVTFTGSISSRGTIGNVVRVRDEKGDVVRVTHHGHTLSFRFVNYGGVDGVDFTTSCTPALRVGLKVDGATMPTRFIHLGDNKVNPGSNPFTVHRRDNDTGTTK